MEEKEIIKIIKECFKEGDRYIEYAEDVLFENSSIDSMLYTPRGIFLGTKDMILKRINQNKKSQVKERRR